MNQEIVLEDGSTCNPWVEDCPVGEDDGTVYSLSMVSDFGRNDVILYGMISSFWTVMPLALYFGDRQARLDALTKNDLYKSTWLVLSIGALAVNAFPGLTWPVSLTSMTSFNEIYLLWA